MFIPSDLYEFVALPATGQYVPDSTYTAIFAGADDDSSAHLERHADRVADLRIDTAGIVTADWNDDSHRREYLAWAQDLEMLQSKPAGDTYFQLGLQLLYSEARTRELCNQMETTGLVYSSANGLQDGQWHVEELLDASRPDDLTFLRSVSEEALYYWHRGDRCVLRSDDHRLIRERSDG